MHHFLTGVETANVLEKASSSLEQKHILPHKNNYNQSYSHMQSACADELI